jgi:4'-phosphopantetheinyl transferase
LNPIYTIYHHARQDFSSLPLNEQEAFLSSTEREKLATFRFPKRRSEWLLGRWTAKQLLRGSKPEFASLTMEQIEISNAPSGKPLLKFLGVEDFQGTLTISHTHQRAFCALTFDPAIKIGADVEKIEPRVAGFCEDYFTPGEIRQRDILPASLQDTWINLVWSAKEAMLKALGEGLRIDTRQVEILSAAGLDEKSDNWQLVQVCSHLPQTCHWAGWWRRQEDFVCTLVVLTPEKIDPSAILLQEVARF